MSQPIAEALAYMLMANERSIKIAPGSSPFSRKQLSSFIRALTESALKVLNFDVNDDGLHRGSMAGRFESDKALLINSHNLRPALAAYLIAIRYMDADIDNILSKSKKSYPVSSTFNNRRYQPYQRVGTITAKKDEHGRYTTLTRDNRAKVCLYKGNTLIFEKTYEIPPRYRGGMMSRYIANSISVDMNQQRFDVSVQHPSSIVAGEREAIYSQQGLRGYKVIPGYEYEIPIYSDINQKNPGNNYKVVVIFV